MEIRIRKGEATDLPAIHNLVRELAIYEKEEPSFTATLGMYVRDFHNGVFQVLVAELEEQVVGMALFYVAYSTWKGKMMYLEDFVVSSNHRGNGIGTRIFKEFLAESTRQECRLVKWQVLDWNEPALRFYAQIGATIEKNWWNGKIFMDLSPK